jgi:hypothetical protein
MAYLRNADTRICLQTVHWTLFVLHSWQLSRLCRLVACLAEPVFMAIDFPDTATPRAHLVDT